LGTPDDLVNCPEQSGRETGREPADRAPPGAALNWSVEEISVAKFAKCDVLVLLTFAI